MALFAGWLYLAAAVEAAGHFFLLSLSLNFFFHREILCPEAPPWAQID
jgi:hypothetical protein